LGEQKASDGEGEGRVQRNEELEAGNVNACEDTYGDQGKHGDEEDVDEVDRSMDKDENRETVEDIQQHVGESKGKVVGMDWRLCFVGLVEARNIGLRGEDERKIVGVVLGIVGCLASFDHSRFLCTLLLVQVPSLCSSSSSFV